MAWLVCGCHWCRDEPFPAQELGTRLKSATLALSPRTAEGALVHESPLQVCTWKAGEVMVAPAQPADRAKTTQAGSLGSSADTVRASGGAPSAWKAVGRTEQKGSISAGARDGLQQPHDHNYPSQYGRSVRTVSSV